MDTDKEKKIVFLFARQRSGTGALSSLLNQHPDCNYLGEVFGDALAQHPLHYFNWLKGVVAEAPELVLPDSGAARLREYLAYLCRNTAERVLVLDVKLSQSHHFESFDKALNATPRLFSMVKDHGYPVVFVRRRNLVRTYLSRLSADRSGVWHTTKDHVELPALPKLAVDTGHMLIALQKLARREAYMDRMRRMYPHAVELEYADMFDGASGGLTDSAAEAFEGVLGLGGLQDIRTKQRKLRPGNLADIVENHAEVRAALAGTEFEVMA